jgi:hypothetical protein
VDRQPDPLRLASTIQSPLHLADHSRPDVTAEIADIGGD